MSRSTRISPALLCLTLFVVPGVADAQLGGLIKRKAADAMKGPEKKEEKAADAPAGLPGGVREMTGASVDALIHGLEVEVALRKEFMAELAKYPTREQYKQCQVNVATSPENQKLIELLMLPDNATDRQKEAAMAKFTEEGAALLKRKCPLDPNDWSDAKKQQRLVEIQTKAAEAAARKRGARGDNDRSPLGGPFLSDDSPGVQGKPSPEDLLKYEMDKERFDVLCRAAADAKTRADGLQKGLVIPGTGPKVVWIFTAEEVKEATPQKCDTVRKLLELIK